MIYLKKKGIFYENNEKYDSKDYEYKKIDSIVSFLNEIIKIDEDFTLEDFFKIVAAEEILMDVIFSSHLGHFSLKPFIEDIQKDCLPESKEDLDYIECSWVAEQFDYKLFYEEHKDDEDGIINQFGGPVPEPESSKNDKKEISIYINIGGVGKNDENSDDIRTGYAIEYIPLYRLKYLPIRLNTEFKLKNENCLLCDNVLAEGEKDFTVFEVFGEILSELSFAGLPKDRDDMWQDIIDTKNKYDEKLENKEEEFDDF